MPDMFPGRFILGIWCTKCYSNWFFSEYFSSTVKVKAIPVKVWTGPEGSGRVTLPDIMAIGT